VITVVSRLNRPTASSDAFGIATDQFDTGVMMARIETKVLTAHVPLPLADKVDQLAARLERSRGWIVKQALGAWVDLEEERSRLTREAMADVDLGRGIDHQSVQAWADSLGTDHALPAPVAR
jgi:predicted transcriptional regulator